MPELLQRRSARVRFNSSYLGKHTFIRSGGNRQYKWETFVSFPLSNKQLELAISTFSLIQLHRPLVITTHHQVDSVLIWVAKERDLTLLSSPLSLIPTLDGVQSKFLILLQHVRISLLAIFKYYPIGGWGSQETPTTSPYQSANTYQVETIKSLSLFLVSPPVIISSKSALTLDPTTLTPEDYLSIFSAMQAQPQFPSLWAILFIQKFIQFFRFPMDHPQETPELTKFRAQQASLPQIELSTTNSESKTDFWPVLETSVLVRAVY